MLAWVESIGLPCRSLRQAAWLTTKLARIIGDGVGFALREEGRESSFIHQPHPGHPIPPVLAELTMLAVGQIARRLGVAPRTVAKWIDSGRLTGIRAALDALDGAAARIEA